MKNLLLPVAFLAFFALSCTEDEEKAPDFRAESVGIYTYSSKAEKQYGGEDLGFVTGTMEISNSSGVITIVSDRNTPREETYTTSSLIDAANGYGFNVSTKNYVNAQSEAFELKGVNGSTIDGSSRHGRYDSGSKQIFMSYQTDYVNNEFDQDNNVSYTLIATKQ